MIYVNLPEDVYSHPFLIGSQPEALSNVKSINEIVTYYSEDIELSFSSIKVLNSDGKRVDNNNLNYGNDEKSLIVTTPELDDGTYTIISKVLSKIDGHIVKHTLVFGVGDVRIDYLSETNDESEIIFWPEAVARFPGFVGQTTMLGAAISSILILSNKMGAQSKISLLYTKKFSFLIKISIISIIISNFLVILIYVIRLDATIIDGLNTTFGKIWLARTFVIAMLLISLIYFNTKRKITVKNQLIICILAFMLVLTTTAISHNASNENKFVMILDYVHNSFSSIWIGGIIFFGFVLLPIFLRDSKIIFYLLLPNFSTLFIISTGILIVTGPIMLWFIDHDMSTIFSSLYGTLIIIKISIASIMISLGGYNQFNIQKKILKEDLRILSSKLRSSLKIEMCCGIILLAVVSLLVNTGLPVNTMNANTDEINDFAKIEFSESIRFDINITPLKIGENKIIITASSINSEDSLDDLEEINLSISDFNKNINDIKIPIMKTDNDVMTYEGVIFFGFYDEWRLNIEAKRLNEANEIVAFYVMIKPHITELKTQITEYDLPDPESKPLYAMYHDNSIWISDVSKARLWQFIIDQEKFIEFNFDGKSTTFLTMDNNKKIWFIDTVDNKIGFIDINKKIETVSLPTKSIATSITSFDNNIWISMMDHKFLLKYDQIDKEFEKYEIPSESSFVIDDYDGNIWFTEPSIGKIGYINQLTGSVNEFTPNKLLNEPFTLFFDSEENLWISEHAGFAITKFDVMLEKFTKIAVHDTNSLPTGIAEDAYGNLWFAQHTTDNLGLYDPYNDKLIEIAIPTTGSFTQFLISDDKKRIWFVEQQSNKLGVIDISETDNMIGVTEKTNKQTVRPTLLIFPLIGIIIIIIALSLRNNIAKKRIIKI